MSGWFEISAADRPATERTEYWRSSVCDQFVPLAVEPDGDALRGRVAGGNVAEMRMRRLRATRHRFERRGTDIAEADPEVLHLLHMDHGETLVEQDDRTATVRAGDLLLYDSTRPFRFRTDDDFQFTICLLPKRLLPVPETVQRRWTARALPTTTGVAAAVAPFLCSLARTSPDADAAQQLALQQAMVSMYVALLAEAGVGGNPPTVNLSLAKSFIARNLGDPRLAPADIAAACSISVSYLHRLFANDDTTVAGHVREQRLQAVHRDLLDAAVEEPVAHVAERWGITDPAHFSRMFKKRFGVSPGELRRSARS
ncbi:MAG TPA: helix-turn-helix domain-containing protein [Nocardioides sp.]|jgi:AraC-like DNA-binding protein|nr:helix-turn-helix domain-containing protein [Nocardioides sp.]